MKFTVLFPVLLTLTLSSCREAENPTVVTKIESNYTGDLSDVTFFNESQGLIVGEFDLSKNRKNVLLRTTDGGETWSVDSLQMKDIRIDAIGFSQGLAFICVTDMVSTEQRVYRSTDNGHSWSQCNSTGMTMVPQMYNQSIGLSSDGGNVLKTVDGGLHWESVYATDELPGAPLLQIAGNTTAYLAAGAHHDGSNGGILMKSSNRGDTGSRLLSWPSVDILSMQFLDDQTGYLFGAYSSLHKTTDGGMTFQLVNDQIEYGASCRFTSELRGVYWTSNTIFITESAGESWRMIFHDDSANLAVTPFPSDPLFVVGRHGLILKIKL